jgi:hypothetical protein
MSTSSSNTFSYYTSNVSSYAAFASPLYGRVFFTNVKITNPKTNKSITLPMLADTGAQNSQIDGTKYAKPLGINDITTGEEATSTLVTQQYKSYKHFLTIQIGNLQPITNVPIFFTSIKPQFNNLGWTGALERYQVIVSPSKITYNEILAKAAAATTAAATAAMGSAQAYYRSRV